MGFPDQSPTLRVQTLWVLCLARSVFLCIRLWLAGTRFNRKYSKKKVPWCCFFFLPKLSCCGFSSVLIAGCITRRKLQPDGWGTAFRRYRACTGNYFKPEGSTNLELAKVTIPEECYRARTGNNYYPTVLTPPSNIARLARVTIHYSTIEAPPSYTIGPIRLTILYPRAPKFSPLQDSNG